MSFQTRNYLLFVVDVRLDKNEENQAESMVHQGENKEESMVHQGENKEDNNNQAKVKSEEQREPDYSYRDYNLQEYIPMIPSGNSYCALTGS